MRRDKMKYMIFDKVNKKYLPKNTRYYVAQDGNVIVEDRGGYATTINQDNYTVELSTGRKDIKDVLVYGGDRVDTDTFDNMEVKYIHEIWWVVDKGIGKMLSECESVEIIGTVHDTPREGE
jgi:hypothetical protein